ncbi:MAG: sugar phosphate isomerase/epimerase [Deltaproteobacteria bacterium]|nr:sugar phosphate isomerase/epimerase [Deltaproteobacteria bacterium]
MFIEEGLNPEIGFNHETFGLYGISDFRRVADALLKAGLTVTFHAPFLDLRPGALDPKIRQVTRDRLQQVFDLVPLFHPRTVVCHPSFDKRYYMTAEKLWLENSIDTWRHFLDPAEKFDTRIALENVYENDPSTLVALLEALPSERVCFCFDTGHFNVFADTPLDSWMEGLAGRLGQVHLHDNRGDIDAHLPPGDGNFPVRVFFAHLARRNLEPILTIEAHSEKDLWQALKNIESMAILKAAPRSAGIERMSP